eukprot:CAMPEP_0201233324 /NCGR_PEP_ID=MMETSP0852-20130820/5186_1 /ASSEMBLY_ACC=CAM_ASM_000632 /TAXON_ID=183588 /ORGANISM="Pseudo-nitzschia fraudulenta, Strain WWA7" /LENGTH=596 /DNA_ID=CAMNT_0047526171 /DNA_START=78 /DNA_END=1868 /DNA_ORIENTATION=+
MRSSSSSFLNSRRNNPGASRLSAENRLGLPRPSLDSLRTSRGGNNGRRYARQPQSEAETDYDSYYDDDDEAEAEALLSRQHGEAAEDSGGRSGSNNNKKKRGTTDQDVADEYAEQEKERKKKARRKVRRTVTPDDLVKPRGLTVVRNGIAPRFHSSSLAGGTTGNPKTGYTNTKKSMAKYSRRLMSAYFDWMEQMTGGLPHQETVWKLRAMGSKNQIKQYLGDMRKTVRDDHVERLLGLEKAQRLLLQLDDYYNEQHPDEYNNNEEEDGNREGRETEESEENGANPSPSPAVANPYAKSNGGPSDTDAAAGGGAGASTTPNAETANVETRGREEQDPLRQRLRLQTEQRARRHVLEDSDDEEEALFDDVVPASATNASGGKDTDSLSSPPRFSATTKAARRHVLDDDDSDDGADADKSDGNGGNESKIESDDGAQGESNDANEHETQDDTTPNTGTQKDASDEDESTGEVNTSASPLDKLDEKFESVKALLEGGETNVPKANPEPTSEEGAEDAMDTDAIGENRKGLSKPDICGNSENEDDGEKESAPAEETTARHDSSSSDKNALGTQPTTGTEHSREAAAGPGTTDVTTDQGNH